MSKHWVVKLFLLLFLFNINSIQAQVKKVALQGFWWDYKNNNYPFGWANYLADLAPRLRVAGLDAIWIPPVYKNQESTPNIQNPVTSNREIYCSNCAKKFSNNVKFCPHCGDPYNGCFKCGADNDKNAKKCVSCGTILSVSGANCTNCNTSLAEGAAFCATCGKPVESKEGCCKRCGHKLGSTPFCSQCGFKNS